MNAKKNQEPRENPWIPVTSDTSIGIGIPLQSSDSGITEKIPTGNSDVHLYTRADIIAAFESGAAFQRQSIFTPQSTNAIMAHAEALARWPE